MLLIGIAAAAFVSTLLGGLLALRLRDKLHLILGFSAGAVIGVAFFDLLPEAVNFGVEVSQSRRDPLVDRARLSVLSACSIGCCCFTATPRRARGSVAAGVLCCHSLLDGVAIGLAFQASRAVGIVVAIAVLTHDFSDGINTMNMVLKNHGTRSACHALAAARCRGTGRSASPRRGFFALRGDGLRHWCSRCSPDSFCTSARAI